MKITEMKLDQLKEYANNPRNNENAVAAVAASIDTFGFKVPIVIDADGVIIAGHTRFKAAQRLGLPTVPCIIADDLTEEQIRAFRLADNKTAELAGWDFDKLDAELAELAAIEFDMTAFGFENFTLEEPQEIVEDEAPEVDEEAEPRCKLGDIWQLGQHRLMCGDSTDPLNIKLLLQGQQADLVFTDPPYGMKKEADGVENDNLNYDDLLEFNKQWIPITFDALKDTGCWYCWGIDEPLMDIYAHILKPMKKENKVVIRNYITWAKHAAFGINSTLALSYPRETEKAWFVMKGQDWNNNNAEFFNTKYAAILLYMQEQAEQVGLKAKDIPEICGVQMYSHWFTKSQFTIIPEKHYRKLQEHYKGGFAKEYNQLLEMIGEDNNKNKKPYFNNMAIENVGGIGLTDVWRFSVTSGKEREMAEGHATPKPIALCSRAINASSREGEIVLDVFGGSGSTLIACEQLNRAARLIELEPKWCDVIIKRWETLTGEKAQLVTE